MENFFSKQMSSKDNSELQGIILKKESFDEEAVLAAIWELDKRGQSDDSTELVKNRLLAKLEARKQKKEGPSISKFVVFLVSFLVATLFGAILMSVNLFNEKKTKGIPVVIGFAIIYTLISIVVFDFFAYQFGVVIIVNALGAAIISEFFWKKYFQDKAGEDNPQ
ncbi:hypothetical protein QQ020_30280 [Fulvivirgaceae bacterium BMA12]|uniref:Uncharacterized protein n=1 Tax=Agaribacillus aureus TaxID=3051825 RepID=A0ABT8LI15_9BACT|nr:hypothetical protein [Fulvivirgaceae bacterium BMA12]